MSWPRLIAGVFGLAVLSHAPSAWAGGGASPVPAPTAHTTAPHPRTKSLMKREWGVDVDYVRSTAGGYMLEFRYKVLDPAKAAPLFDRQTKPMLTHEKSGAKMIVPTPGKVGALRNSNEPLEGHFYWMFFANPGKLVQPGDLVTIEIGRFEAKGLVVE